MNGAQIMCLLTQLCHDDTRLFHTLLILLFMALLTHGCNDDPCTRNDSFPLKLNPAVIPWSVETNSEFFAFELEGVFWIVDSSARAALAARKIDWPDTRWECF